MGKRWDSVPADMLAKLKAAEREGTAERKDIIGADGQARELVPDGPMALRPA